MQRHQQLHMQKTREDHVLVHTRHTTDTTRTTHRLVSSPDVVACSLLVGCWLCVCCMLAVSLDWLVGCHRRTRMRTVSCAVTLTKHRAGQHTKTETGDSEELNSEGSEKRRRQRESRVNSGVEKKSPVTNIDTKKKRCTCLAWLTNRDSKIAKIKLITFGY